MRRSIHAILFWPTLGLVLCLMVASLGGCADDSIEIAAVQEAAAGKNLVVVLLDAAAANHFGSYGYERDTTPHLDAVAAESVLFERAYAQASGTMLSVFSFFTSRYPVFEPERGFRPWAQVKTIPAELPTFAELLAPDFPARLGYTSNVWMKRNLGHARGFTEYWELWAAPKGRFDDDAGGVKASTEWMLQHAQRRFLSYVHIMKPHGPYDPPDPWFSRFTDRAIDPKLGTHEFLMTLAGKEIEAEVAQDIVALYDANLAYADALIGGMIEELKEAGLWESTVFVVMSDHGQGLFAHGGAHGHGGRVVEAMIHVPLFVRIPGVPPRRVRAPVELVDLLPTLLDLMGRPAPAGTMAGRSLLPEIAGRREDADRWIHSRTNRRNPPIYSLNLGDHKLTAQTPGRSLKAIEYALYDLESDPGESRNLLREEGETPLSESMRERMLAWLKSGGEAGAAIDSVTFDVFDEREVERLRSLGYVE